jgi:hypothetical protein
MLKQRGGMHRRGVHAVEQVGAVVKRLGLAPWQCTPPPLTRSAALFGEEPNSIYLSATKFSGSRSVQLLPLPETQDGAQRLSFCVGVGNSTERDMLSNTDSEYQS